MGNQNDTLNIMHLDQKTQLLDHALFFPEGKEVTGEATSASRHRETVVAGEFQGVVQEVVEVFPVPAIAAIDGGGPNAVLIETNRTLEYYVAFSVVHVYELNRQRRRTLWPLNVVLSKAVSVEPHSIIRREGGLHKRAGFAMGIWALLPHDRQLSNLRLEPGRVPGAFPGSDNQADVRGADDAI